LPFVNTEINFQVLGTFFYRKKVPNLQKSLGGDLRPWGFAPIGSVCLLCKKRNPVGISKIVLQFLKQQSPLKRVLTPKLYVSFATYLPIGKS
jgi:hypothetical protein